ncbi:ABC transporter substrate-binding protein [Candidatus Entotheonella palauensis]|uniref:Solute-binding protein family 5 domain-containing protein n=1 Tax=Candidatus Entotheonella gemina TaxID=1429439 RepID=W4MFI8_9BACT|nr:ABC transporter substrate-binding protein [Candidatus Entotheonella palauensis]ETX09104.1 MAG: hypothetical protein ETSY2_01435 [Candidatus Entotheonella gemina]
MNPWKKCRRLGALALVLAVFVSAHPAAWAASDQLGALVGKFEAPEIITDPSKWPQVTGEAPEFEAQVKAGKLPPVAERVGQDPLVIKPVHEIGKYGGIWKRGYNGPADYWLGLVCCAHDQPLYYDGQDPTATTVVPNVLKSWEVNEDHTEYIFHTRRGMKWSDGAPFTAGDFLFWYEDMYLNDELNPAKPPRFNIAGEPGVMTKIDETTFKVTFQSPYPFFPRLLAGATALAGSAYQNRLGQGFFAPKHYLKQYHPKYNPNIEQVVQEAGYDNWVNLFKFKGSWGGNPDLPVVTPWKTTKSYTDPPFWVMERNPYYWGVDTAGNQLPYIEKVILHQYESLEIHAARSVAGEYDFQGSQMLMESIPALLQNAEAGNYHVRLYPTDFGSDFVIKFNMSYEEDPVIAKLFHEADFRRALSLGIDREQLNEVFWLGTAGRCGSVVPPESNPYYPGKEYETLWSTYKPDEANQMLDGLGLTQKDAQGYRLRPDGKGRVTLEMISLPGQHFPFTRGGEMVAEHWKKIGIELRIKELERGAAFKFRSQNTFQLWAWNNDGSDHLWTSSWHIVPYYGNTTSGPLWGKWYATNGKEGQEPEPWMKTILANYRKGFGVSKEERIPLGKEIWKIAAEQVYIIATCGLSAANWGVAVVNNNLGNIPGRIYVGPDAKFYGIARPQTFYYKNR